MAEAVEVFGRVDILFCCTSVGTWYRSSFQVYHDAWFDWVCIATIGTVEELGASQQTLTLVREQFETNFFGPVNIIKAVLPSFRERKNGHIILLTGISAS